MAITITFKFTDEQQARVEAMVRATCQSDDEPVVLTPAQILAIVKSKMKAQLKKEVLRYEKKQRHITADINAPDLEIE